MSRAIDLTLHPAALISAGASTNVFTYTPASVRFPSMTEAVYLVLDARRASFTLELSRDEARVLANQLLQVADTCDEHRAARLEDEALQASFDAISDELREAEERGGTGCYHVHPDVHYVPADQVQAKVRELEAAGAKRYMVLADPTSQEAA